MEVVLLFTTVIGLLLIGVPIAVSLGMSSVIFLLAFSDSSLASDMTYTPSSMGSVTSRPSYGH